MSHSSFVSSPPMFQVSRPPGTSTTTPPARRGSRAASLIARDVVRIADVADHREGLPAPVDNRLNVAVARLSLRSRHATVAPASPRLSAGAAPVPSPH